MNTSLKTYKTELEDIRVEEMKIENVIDDLKDQAKLTNKVIKAKDVNLLNLKSGPLD